MRRFKYVVLLLAFALLGFVSLAYLQDTPNPSDAASDPSALLRILVGILIVSVILVGVVFWGFWKNPLNASIQELTQKLDFNQLSQIAGKLETLNRSMQALRQQLDYSQADEIALRIEQELTQKLDFNQLSQIANKLETLNRSMQALRQQLDYSQADETALRIEQELKSIRNGIDRNTKQLAATTSEQSSILAQQQNLQAKFEELENQLETFKNWKEDITFCQREAARVVKDTQERVEKLAEVYREGGPIEFTALENLSPVQELNVIASDIHQWRTELETYSQPDANLAQVLASGATALKDKLKGDRGSPPIPMPLDLETDISTKTALDRLRQKCSIHVTQFEKTLSDYETEREIDVEAYDQFIFGFIKDRLFNSLTPYFEPDQLPEQLNKFLRLVDLEVVPITLGETIADARLHQIQGSRQTDQEPGTVVEIVLPGLRRRTDGAIVQEPVVIRGE